MKKLLVLFFCLWSLMGISQQRTPYNQYYLQPVLINPAYTGESGITNVFLNHRVQWSGVEDAPVTTSAILQVPVTERIALGAELYSDRHSSVLRTHEAKFNAAYTLYFDHQGRNYLTFGLSLGVGRNMIEFEGTDAAIMNAQDRSFYFNGRFGTVVHMGRASFGLSLPQLMDTDILNQKDFEDLGIEATKQSIIHGSYSISLSPVFDFTPMALYRLDKYGKNQAEGVGILYYKNMIWAGAGYRQDYGAIGHFGMNVKQALRISYSYEFAPEQSTGIGNGSHEFQLTYTFGKTNKKRQPRQLISSAPPPAPATLSEEKVAKVLTTSDPVAEEKTRSEAKPVVAEKTAPAEPKEETSSIPAEPVSNVAEPMVEPETITEQETPEDKKEVKWLEVDESREVSSLPKGCYLVVGAFVKADNAIRYQEEVSRLGYRAQVAYDEATNFNYVYINKAVEAKYLHAQRDVIRKKTILYFPEAWILEIR